jgi:lysophospholipid acyltransferase (LPLAT)-like uncharacterized protein
MQVVDPFKATDHIATEALLAVRALDLCGNANRRQHLSNGHTWDRFVIPCPFSRVSVTFGEPLLVSKGLDAEALENERIKIESLLVSGTDDA